MTENPYRGLDYGTMIKEASKITPKKNQDIKKEKDHRIDGHIYSEKGNDITWQFCKYCKKQMFNDYTECNCKEFIKEKILKEKQKEERKKIEQKIKDENRIKSLNIPPRYKDSDLKDFDLKGSSISDYLKNVTANIKNGKGLILLAP